MIRWGVLGFGHIAKRFNKSLENSERGELFALATRSKSKRATKDYPHIKVFDDYDELLLDPEIDAIYIALPHKDHYTYSMKALENNKAVLCEKPATLKVSELEEILECSQKKKILWMEALKTRFIPGIDRLKSLLKDGVIGDIVRIEASFCDETPYDPDSYLFDQQQGGAIYDVATYPLGFVLDLIDGSPMIKESVVRNKYGVDVFFKTTLTYEDIEIIIEGGKDVSKPHDALIIGTKGSIQVPTFNRPTRLIVRTEQSVETLEVPLLGDDMFGEIEAFHDSLLRNDIENKKMKHDDSLDIMNLIEEMRKKSHES